MVLTLREQPARGEDVEKDLGGPEHRAGVWWFHVEVSNARRRVPVHEVRAVLCRVEDERGRVLWDQYLDLVWALDHGRTRSVGPPALADLCALYEHRIAPSGEDQGRVLLLLPADPPPKSLPIAPRLFPNDFPRRVPAKQPVVLTLMARGLEGDSDPVRVRVAWDGEWPATEDRRRDHLSVTVVA